MKKRLLLAVLLGACVSLAACPIPGPGGGRPGGGDQGPRDGRPGDGPGGGQPGGDQPPDREPGRGPN